MQPGVAHTLNHLSLSLSLSHTSMILLIVGTAMNPLDLHPSLEKAAQFRLLRC